MPPYKRQKKENDAIEFDLSARADFLTGFHKRKLQRIKHAREEAIKREKAEKITERKRLREMQRKELENHVEAVNALLRQQADREVSDDDGAEYDDADEGEWTGFDDLADGQPVPIDHEDEYIDEDRYTTVTVESIDITKCGLRKSMLAGAGSEEGDLASDDAAATKEEGIMGGKGTVGGRLSAKRKPSAKPKIRKKFRYLSKGDRKAARIKERSGNKAKAKARRG